MSIGVKARKTFHINEADIINKLAEGLYCCIIEEGRRANSIAIICIGSDRATGDSLGPITGHIISRKIQNPNIAIYGSLAKPVHAANIEQTMDRIYSESGNSLIIAIDAALSRKADCVGVFNMGIGSLNPGAFAEKDLLSVGHIYLTGVVNWTGKLGDVEVLQSTRLGFVMKMAEIMSEGIELALTKWQKTYGIC